MRELIDQFIRNRKAFVMGHENLFKSAVLLPLVERNGEWCVLFEERAHHLNRQPGEICFPGGRMDPDDVNPQMTAVRETCEELGLRPTDLEILGELDQVINQFQMVQPFVGRIFDWERIQPDSNEVASVFFVPFDFLKHTEPDLHYVDLQMTPREDFPFEKIPNGRNYKWRKGQVPEYFYEYEGRIIWGLTARILHHFINLVRE
ncbi:NUDIX hydrolase [Effusibacillus dendaii]|uniref:Coenzyme A pyrophosphatase n=1 Tax=Effusibacillus dendaii TaxID=2743772 RepID=A0A7I8DBY0_9BACL|nr:CoA pyrophosphatase [Effusibacillus dendaii]BCJ86346.1 coenzyme A pyrophosphatase [Effusibacillus dendaii]